MKNIKTTPLIITLVAVVIVAVLWINNRTSTPVRQTEITITEQALVEENFTGSRPVISGDSSIVLAANTYLDESIASFKTDADKEVPELRKQFGETAPPAQHSLDFRAIVESGARTESIVLDGYRYTGGANGMSFYKVFTMDTARGELLSLGDVIPSDRRSAFTQYVQAKILAEQEGIFEDSVKALTFDSFKHFAFTTDAMVVYFDKYEIGAGALGAVAFSIPLSEIQDFISL